MSRNTTNPAQRPIIIDQAKFLLGSTAMTTTRVAALAFAAGLLGVSAVAHAESWTDVNFVSGSGASSMTGAYEQTIDVASDNALITTTSANIAANAKVIVNQNGANSILVNKILDVNPTTILGALTANGQIVLLNPNGIMFGQTAKLDVAGLVASTGKLDEGAFVNTGAIRLSDIVGGSIVNDGSITIRDGGLAAFVAPTVRNNGTIVANLGRVALASGDAVTVDLYGDGLVEYAVDAKVDGGLVENNGTIKASKVALTTAAAKGVVDNIINMGGVIEATTATQTGGTIVLGGEDAVVTVDGTLNASGTNGGGEIDVTGKDVTGTSNSLFLADAIEKGNGGNIELIADRNMLFNGSIYARGGALSGNGGFAEVSGENVGFAGYANMSAANGDIGSFLIDPLFAIIHSGSLNNPLGFDYVISAEALADSLANSNVTVQADEFIDVGTKLDGYNTGNPLLDLVLSSLVGTGTIDLSSGDITTTTVTGYHADNPSNPGLVNACSGPAAGSNPHCIADITTTTTSGITTGSLTLDSNIINFNKDLIMGLGNVNVQANTVNLDSKLWGFDGTDTILLGQSRLTSTATLVNVLSNAALIQQGVYLSDVGGTVYVSSGTYEEQVDIDKNLDLVGEDKDTTIIKSPVVLSESFNSGNSNKGVVYAHDADTINVSNLTIDGAGRGNGNYRMFGLLYKDVEGTVDNVHVTGIQETPFSGNQHGVAIQSYNTDAQARTWTVQNSEVDNFQKNGITATGEGLTANILNNTVTGAGATTVTAQNGIQLSYGAGGTIQGNTISGIGYTPSSWSASSVLVFDAADGVVVDNNTINGTGVDMGVAVISSANASVTNNNINGSGIGILIDSGDYEPYTSWGIVGNSDNAVVTGNTVADADVGIYLYDVKDGTVSQNNVSSTSGSDTGIVIEEGDGTLVNRNTVDGYNVGMQDINSKHTKIRNNDITVLDDGIVSDNSSTYIELNTITGPGTNDTAKNGVFVTDSDANTEETVRVLKNTISGFGEGVDVRESSSSLIVKNNFINGNREGVNVGEDADGSKVTIFDNDLSGNTIGVENKSGETVDASFNWWGSNDEATVIAYQSTVNGGVDVSPYQAVGVDVDGNPNNGYAGSKDTLYVTDDGAQDSGLIQEAIDLLNEGGTIYVNDGLYTENFVINKTLKLTGLSTAVVQAEAAGNLVTVTAEDVNIDPIVFDGLGIANYGIYANGAGANGLVVDGNTFKGFKQAGIYLAANSASTGTIMNNIFEGSSKRGVQTGALNGGYELNITDNVIGGIGNEVVNGLLFGGDIKNATVNISGGSINSNGGGSVNGDAIHFAKGTGNGSQVNISDIAVVSNGDEAIDFQQSVRSGSTVNITGGSYTGGNNGVEFSGIEGDVTITGAQIVGQGADKRGVNLLGSIKGNLDIENSNITGGDDGIGSNETKANTVNGGTVTVKGSTVTGVNGDGIELGSLSNGAVVEIEGNIINGGANGIALMGGADASLVKIVKNDNIKAGENGIIINGELSGDTDIQIDKNRVRQATNGSGIVVSDDTFGGVNSLELTGNSVWKAGQDGIAVVNTGNTKIDKNNIGYYGSGHNPVNGTNVIAQDGISAMNADGAQITNNFVTNTGGDGVYAKDSAGVVINSNTISETHSTSNEKGSGVQVVSSNGAVISQNVISDAEWDGVRVIGGMNVSIDKNTATDSKRAGIFAKDLKNSSITENTIDGTDQYRGISVAGGNTVAVSGNKVDNTKLDGVIANGVSGLTISGNFIGKNGGNIGDDGIEVVGSHGAQITGNQINDAAGNGIYNNGSNNTTISGNMITNVDKDGVLVNPSLGVTVSGNTIDNVADDGVEILNSNNAVVSGNFIGTVGGVDNIGDNGVEVNNSADVSITSNTIKNTHDHGAEANLSATQDILIGWNTVSYAGWDGINVEGGKNIDVRNNAISFVDFDGIDVSNSDSPNIYYNTIHHVGMDADGNGIEVTDSDWADVNANWINNTSDDGIELVRSDNANIFDNYIGTLGAVDNIGNNGIYVADSADVDVKTNTIKNTKDHGVEADLSATQDILIGWNTISDAGWDGINVDGGKNIDVRNNTIYDIDFDGIEVSNSDSPNIYYNTIRFVGGEGIEVTNSAWADINANDIDGTGSDAIHVASSDKANVFDNEINKHVWGTTTNGDGVEIVGSYDVDVYNNVIDDVTENGVYINGSNSAWVSGNTITDAQGHGVKVNPSDDVEIVSNVIDNVDGDGVNVDRGARADILNNRISNVRYDGIDVDNNANVEIGGNTIYNTGDNGIEVSDSYNADIRYNDIDEVDGDGINVENADYADIYGNEINVHRNGANTLGNGITLTNSDHVEINNNNIDDTRNVGIDLYNTDDVAVYDNLITDAYIGIRLNDGRRGRGIDGADIDNNTIRNVEYGIVAYGVSNLNIEDNNIDGRYHQSGDGEIGIYVENSNGARIGGHHDGNTVEDFDIGIRVVNSDYADVNNNDVSEFDDYGIWASYSRGIEINYNDVYDGNGSGIRVYQSDYADINGNDIWDVSGNGIELINSDWVDIFGNEIDDVGANGIFVDPSDHVEIAYNDIDDAAQDGIHVEYGHGAVIYNNVVDDSGDEGIEVYDNDGVVIAGNTVTDSDDNGIKVSNSYDAGIYGNTVRDSGDDGIDLENSAYADIRGNTVRYSGDDGIDVENSYRVDVVDNHVHGARSNGIEISNSYDADVIGNRVHYTGADGIYLENSDYADIRYNDVHDTGDDGIDVRGGVGVDIVDNRVEDADGDGIQVRGSRWVDVNGNTIEHTHDDGIDVENSAFAEVNGNVVSRTRHNGIEVENSFDADVRYNRVAFAGDDGIFVNNAVFGDVRNNIVNYVGDDGIDVRKSFGVDIADNFVGFTGGDGIQVRGSNWADVNDNWVMFVGDDGIDVENGFGLSVSGNHVHFVRNNGIEVEDAAFVGINDNTVSYAGGAGIFVDPSFAILIGGNDVSHNAVGIHLQDVDGVMVDNNSIHDNRVYGLLADGRNGYIQLTNNIFTNNPVGARFESGEIDISDLANPNSFIGGNTALEFDGPVVSLVDDTLGGTIFEGQSDYYVALSNGALYDPGTPTIIEGRFASYDGFSPASVGGILTPAERDAIESMLWDFDDDNTLGQIFVGIVPSVDFRDILNNEYNGLGPLGGARLIITGLPRATLGGAGGFAAAFNALTPAAGEEEGNEGNGNDFAAALNSISPAAGQEQDAATQFNALSPASGLPEVTSYAQAFDMLAQSNGVDFNMSNDPRVMLGLFGD